jgi:hypothetical protein
MEVPMSQQIVDLSAVAGPPKKVRFQEGGEIFKFPADIPVPLYLRLTTLEDEELDDNEAAQEIYDELLELAQVHQPDVDSLPIGLVAMVQAIPRIYGDAPDEEDGKPTRPTKGGTRSTKTRKRSRSSKS